MLINIAQNLILALSFLFLHFTLFEMFIGFVYKLNLGTSVCKQLWLMCSYQLKIVNLVIWIQFLLFQYLVPLLCFLDIYHYGIYCVKRVPLLLWNKKKKWTTFLFLLELFFWVSLIEIGLVQIKSRFRFHSRWRVCYHQNR